MRSGAAVAALRQKNRGSKYKPRSADSRAAPPAVSPPTALRSKPEVFWLYYQERVYDAYHMDQVQMVVACLIFTNFAISAVNAQLLPVDGSDAKLTFFYLEIFFTLVFLVELAWNMYGSACMPFWRSGWNVFDLIIVLISVFSLIMKGLPTFNVLRLFRAFRVIRMFKRIKSLRLIIEGVLSAMPGVTNAFLVLAILMGIWSIMGVEFFGAVAQEEFGTFFAAMLTMFQVMTMDAWGSGIARKLIYKHNFVYIAPVFFILFVFIAGIVMTNVVVAILLEKYLSAIQKNAKQKRLDAKNKANKSTGKPSRSKTSRNSKKTSASDIPPQPKKKLKTMSKWKKAASLATVISKAKREVAETMKQSQKEVEEKRKKQEAELKAMKKMMSGRRKSKSAGRRIGRRMSRKSFSASKRFAPAGIKVHPKGNGPGAITGSTTNPIDSKRKEAIACFENVDKSTEFVSMTLRPKRAPSRTDVTSIGSNQNAIVPVGIGDLTAGITPETDAGADRRPQVQTHNSISSTSPSQASIIHLSLHEEEEPVRIDPKGLRSFLHEMIDDESVGLKTLLALGVRMAGDLNVDPQRIPADLVNYVRRRAVHMEDEVDMYPEDDEDEECDLGDEDELSVFGLLG